jgi:hypothetical protein
LKNVEFKSVDVCNTFGSLKNPKKKADNHAVTERSDVKSSRLRLPSESWAEENLLP